MKKLTIRIIDIIDTMMNTAVPPLLADSPIFNINPFITMLKNDCLMYEFDYYTNEIQLDEINACNYLISLWNDFIAFNQNEITRIETALTSTYDVLENYNLTEKSINVENLTDIENKSTIAGSISNSNSGNSDNNFTETYTSPFNNSEQLLKDKIKTGISTTNTTNYNNYENTNTETHKDLKTKSFDDLSFTGNNITENVLTRKGNIGVQTSTDMISKEIELRQKQYIQKIFNTFKNKYLFMVL